MWGIDLAQRLKCLSISSRIFSYCIRQDGVQHSEAERPAKHPWQANVDSPSEIQASLCAVVGGPMYIWLPPLPKGLHVVVVLAPVTLLEQTRRLETTAAKQLSGNQFT